jgi:hypothetical protein
MNIVELRDRLTQIIDENNKRFPNENRNQHECFAHVTITKRVHQYIPVQFACSCLMGFKDNKNGFELILNDDKKLEYGRNQKRD